MNRLWLIALCVSELIAVVSLLLAFHERGWRRGRKQGLREGHEAGYERGRQDECNWWQGIEQQADRERQKMWKEER